MRYVIPVASDTIPVAPDAICVALNSGNLHLSRTVEGSKNKNTIKQNKDRSSIAEKML